MVSGPMARPRKRKPVPTPVSSGVTSALVLPPRRANGVQSWTLESIRYARDLQMRGDFKQPVRLAEAMRTDDAIFTAYMTRVSTQLSVCLKREPPERGRLQSTIDRLDDSVCTPPHVRQSILGTLANHGIAIGYVLWSVKDTDAGPTVAFELTEWPLEHVRYLQSDSSL